jgi:2'-hydroxyisoflavone reductase
MNLLILGGTKFVGRHIAAHALVRGHQVTLFNRGQTNVGIFPGAEKLTGDRDGGLDILSGRTWDTVIDVNGYLPRVVGASAQLLKNAVARYVFISSISVFADFSIAGQNEDAPLARLQDPTTEVIDGDTYGGLKVACEQVVRQTFPERALILRPGYVVGPHDPTDRMTAWLRRITRGGEMLAPGSPDAPIQFIDGRDLAAFVVDMTERQATGIYNLNGLGTHVSWGEVFEEALRLSGADTRLTWVDENFMRHHNLEGGELPMVAYKEDAGVFTFNNHKAIAAGLHFRPTGDTIQDTLLWDAAEGEHKLGLSSAREAELLRAYRQE